MIIVLWRKSDETAYWKEVTDCVKGEERRLKFDKEADFFDRRCADRIGALTSNTKPFYAVPGSVGVAGQGTHRRLGNSPRGVASRAASKASLSAVSDNANLIAGALAMRAINT